MNTTDIIGSIGVLLLLLAYVLHLRRLIDRRSYTYLLMNTLGAGLACLASFLLAYWPFVVLEAVWTIVSLVELIRYMLPENRR